MLLIFVLPSGRFGLEKIPGIYINLLSYYNPINYE